jgi:hypothetical protein
MQLKALGPRYDAFLQPAFRPRLKRLVLFHMAPLKKEPKDFFGRKTPMPTALGGATTLMVDHTSTVRPKVENILCAQGEPGRCAAGNVIALEGILIPRELLG